MADGGESAAGREVARLCAVARQHALRGEATLAVAAYLDAWDLLPEPRAGPQAAEIVAGLARVVAQGDVRSAAMLLHGARDAFTPLP